ncbi:MAG: hypothetical protein A2Y25_05900 [Candidatus Melainabacteria bacterium GWF2_37_15]|nr:MAG: hypothetical protein A2Y25_05900 [Candidatus Melainabacteria bacterium GWF2_37_15]
MQSKSFIYFLIILVCFSVLLKSEKVYAADPASTNIVPTDGTTTVDTVTVPGSYIVTPSTVSGSYAISTYQYFDLDTGDTAIMVLPTGTSYYINRLDSGYTNPFNIYGNLISKLGTYDGATGGHIIFINPYGIHVGPNASISTGSLTLTTASSLKIGDSANLYVASLPSDLSDFNHSVITYEGIISTATPDITNEGTINADYINIVAGNIENRVGTGTAGTIGNQTTTQEVNLITAGNATYNPETNTYVTNTIATVDMGGINLALGSEVYANDVRIKSHATDPYAGSVTDVAINLEGLVKANQIGGESGKVELSSESTNPDAQIIIAKNASSPDDRISALGTAANINIKSKKINITDSSGDGISIISSDNGIKIESLATTGTTDINADIQADGLLDIHGFNTINILADSALTGKTIDIANELGTGDINIAGTLTSTGTGSLDGVILYSAAFTNLIPGSVISAANDFIVDAGGTANIGGTVNPIGHSIKIKGHNGVTISSSLESNNLMQITSDLNDVIINNTLTTNQTDIVLSAGNNLSIDSSVDAAGALNMISQAGTSLTGATLNSATTYAVAGSLLNLTSNATMTSSGNTYIKTPAITLNNGSITAASGDVYIGHIPDGSNINSYTLPTITGNTIALTMVTIFDDITANAGNGTIFFGAGDGTTTFNEILINTNPFTSTGIINYADLTPATLKDNLIASKMDFFWTLDEETVIDVYNENITTIKQVVSTGGVINTGGGELIISDGLGDQGNLAGDGSSYTEGSGSSVVALGDDTTEVSEPQANETPTDNEKEVNNEQKIAQNTEENSEQKSEENEKLTKLVQNQGILKINKDNSKNYNGEQFVNSIASYSAQENEFTADAKAMEFAESTGYHPAGMAGYLISVNELEKQPENNTKMNELFTYRHPKTVDRLDNMKNEMTKKNPGELQGLTNQQQFSEIQNLIH